MANLINADPTNGLKLISDSSSEIQLQANGTTVATVNSSGLDLGANTLTQNNLTGFTAKAWVKFNGTGTPAIIGSGNVSSITDIGTGTQTVNFTTAMPDTNYAAIVTTTWAAGVTEYVTGLIYNDAPYAPATTSVTTKTYNFNTGAAIDSSIVMLVIFR